MCKYEYEMQFILTIRLIVQYFLSLIQKNFFFQFNKYSNFSNEYEHNLKRYENVLLIGKESQFLFNDDAIQKESDH